MEIEQLLLLAGAEEYPEEYLITKEILTGYHERGCDEFANRALKDLSNEKMPFLKFNPNAAWYYTMLLSHFVLEAFKEDVCSEVILASSYATTVRRYLVDITGKIVCHGGKVILKITQSVWDRLHFSDLWARCNNQPPLPSAVFQKFCTCY